MPSASNTALDPLPEPGQEPNEALRLKLDETSSPRAFHPPLFALHPALSLYAANISLIPWMDTLVPMGFCLLVTLVLWLLFWAVTRDLGRAAAGASVLVYGIFSYSALSEAYRIYILEGPPGDEAHRAPLWIWALLTAIPFFIFVRKNRLNNATTLFLNVAGSTMCLLSLASIGVSHFRIQNAIRAPKTSSQTIGLGSPAPKRDIFYVILDGYGRSDTFKRLYGFDNSRFVKALEKRGFYVASNAHSNYCQTELSLSSSLNMEPVQDLVKPIGKAEEDRGVLDHLIDQSKVSGILKSHGYEYLTVTTGFPALSFKTADRTEGDESGPTLYFNALLGKTPLPLPEKQVVSQFDFRRDALRSGFASLERLAEPTVRPRFVFVHILAPHPPFVFGPNGEPRSPKGGFGFWDGSHFNKIVGDDATYRTGYREQLQYISKLMLKSVDVLTSQPNADPIVLIQGDHGPKSGLDQNSLKDTDVREVFSILSAYRVPEEVKKRLYPSITPFNSFRIVLSELFGEKLPALADRSYYSTWDNPLQFEEVTKALSQAQSEQHRQP